MASAEHSRQYRQRHPDRVKAYQARRQAEETETIRAQRRKSARKALGAVDPSGETRNGMCEICRLDGPLHYDHNHETGAFRGWLCGACNRAIGMLRDSPEMCRRAAEYLDR